jgi:hypothetical protein
MAAEPKREEIARPPEVAGTDVPPEAKSEPAVAEREPEPVAEEEPTAEEEPPTEEKPKVFFPM